MGKERPRNMVFSSQSFYTGVGAPLDITLPLNLEVFIPEIDMKKR